MPIPFQQKTRIPPQKNATGVDRSDSIGNVKWGRLFLHLSPYKGQMICATLALLISTAFGLGFPLLLAHLLNSVSVAHSIRRLNGFALQLAGILFGQAFFSFLHSYFFAKTGV